MPPTPLGPCLPLAATIAVQHGTNLALFTWYAKSYALDAWPYGLKTYLIGTFLAYNRHS